MEMNQYLEVFIDEGREHLQACNENLLKLEKNPSDTSIVNDIFRSAHTLKGMSATMGFENMANLTHQMENVLDLIRNGKQQVTPELLDTIFMAMDVLERMLDSIEAGGDGNEDVSELLEKFKALEAGAPPNEGKTEAKEALEPGRSAKMDYDEFERTVIEQSKDQGFQCYEISVHLRKDCLLKAARVYMVFNLLEKSGDIIKSSPPVEQLEEENFEDSFMITLITNEAAGDIEQKILKVSEIEKVEIVPVRLEKPKAERTETGVAGSGSGEDTALKREEKDEGKESAAKKSGAGHKTIRVSIERLDILMNLFEELVIDRGRLEQIAKELQHNELKETVEKMSRISNDLQTIILSMRMIPIETVFNRFPKMVRQVSRELNKKINLQIIGAETELDRTVIDEIGDPLVHLLRNSMDHGIETPEVRRQKGKPEEGTIVLKAYHSGNHVFIEISDDGAGIDKKKVVKKAVEKGIISESAAARLEEKAIFDLLFTPGFSTADRITDLSGRGVGLDVVKNTIESLGGSISVHSEEGVGTRFSIQLPLTLTIISVLLVEVGKEKYAIPLSSILETSIIHKKEIFFAHNQPVIDFRGKVVPLLYLKDVFQVPDERDASDYLSVVVIRKGEKLAALVVDAFIGQQEIVLKSLGNYLTNVFAISGATILGDGQVALIVDCNTLIH
ncbi:chemotaxis protein CheA [Caldibacillus debilis]|uniref:Chemotaxis protein CheA n=1 Tax=Caldibacillus debilis GB1 TaxID=1339248 RepID=A0A420VBJ8_9BACI|nr:chemotaxis protein CheA [Caldibacillus debilis]RKO60935.1 Chemotaxi protein histidine kinase and related kinase [Caldibacillus debilis GB1]